MTIFENVRIVNFNPPSVSGPVDVAVPGGGEPGSGGILEVGPGLSAKYPGARRVSGAFLSPGLVCSHTHLYSALARGLTVPIKPSKDFAQILVNLWWRLDRAIDLPILEASALAGLSDAAMCGVTSVIDHHAGPEAIDGSLSVIRKAYDEIGLRGILCYETTDRNGMEGARAGIRENRRFAKEIDEERSKGPRGPGPGSGGSGSGGPNSGGPSSAGGRPLVDAMIGAHAGFTVGQESLEALSDAMRATGRGLHIHLAEDRFDAVDSRYRFALDPVERFDRAGCLGPKTVIGHGLWLTESEVEIMNARGSYLAHNARSNMNNAVGYNGLLHRHERVVLGTDGMGADMLEEFKFAVFRHRESGGPWWPPEFLAALDRGNRIIETYFGGTSGKVEAGANADLVLWDYDAPTPLDGDNVAGHFAFGLSSRSVLSVMVDGKFVVDGRKPLFDSRSIAAKARSEAARLWKRMEERT
ncbi:MAG: putative aminohydrolase SsnA [Treponema sp.]|nr:putative aminohydrolase SsnA [Treponema sp.]